jgi:hypothetical protein
MDAFHLFRLETLYGGEIFKNHNFKEKINRNIFGSYDQGGGLGKNLEWEKIKEGGVNLLIFTSI